jgi:hypothetical protein
MVRKFLTIFVVERVHYMRRTTIGRCLRRTSAPVLTALALALAPAMPASADSASARIRAADGANQGGSVQASLARAFASGSHIAGSALGAIRPGTLHTGTAAGTQWAIATFDPAESASPQDAAKFQDGASSGVFSKTGGSWHLVSTGMYGCASGLPASLKSAWHITAPAACDASPGAQSAAAKSALAAMPAATRAKAAAATANRTAASATAASATDPADLGSTIAAIALSQVGVQTNPPVPNFNTVDCNPYSTMVAGFSSDADGCGYDSSFGVTNQNETWCSDFAKWVWQQAGVTADMNTLNAGATSFYSWAVAQGQNPQIDAGTFAPGDAVLFYYPGDFPGYADHVGLISAVHADGSIDMVNGDFAGEAAVNVQYAQNITDLSAFAASVENPGEQWVLVAPPAAAQQPNPTGRMDAATVAVDGATGAFHASGSVPGGTITGYYWTFGDTRMTNEDGADVTHVFSEPGAYTATVTITSSFGTTTTIRKNIRVVSASAGVQSAPVDEVWYDPLPVAQYTFVRSHGALAVDYWNGGQWIQWAVPGNPDANGAITALTYPDTANADVNTAHAFYRAANGSLAETSQTTSGWKTRILPGSAIAGGAVNATTTSGGDAEVFFVNAQGRLSADTESAAGWSTKVLTPAHVQNPGSLILADTTSGPVLLGAGPGNLMTASQQTGPVWATEPLPFFASAGSSLAAATTPAGTAEVFYTTPTGTLGAATQSANRNWTASTLPGSPKATGGKAATSYLLPAVLPAQVGDFPNPPGTLTDTSVAEPLGMEVFYLTATGAPAVTYDDGTGWQAKTLPGTGEEIEGAGAYQVDEEASNLFLNNAGTITEETTGARSGDPSGTWAASNVLPSTPATWANQIILYAADPADAAIAKASAAASGLPASQVTTSYATAWADALDGNYIVYAVGAPALRALYSNVCGWANPSGLPGGGTPFSYILGPVNTLAAVGPGMYVDSVGQTAADTQAITTDQAYYALHGALPPGVTALPTQAGSTRVCAGSPN